MLNSSDVEKYYQEYLKKGYWKQFAQVKAENAVRDQGCDINKGIRVQVAGVGECTYTGD